MLTSSTSQYLHSDYLQPLPTTLDAKKSPLALLAQTCSSIGKDTTPSKPLIPPLEKKTEGKSSPTVKHDRKERDERRETSSSDSSKSFRTPAPKEIPPLVPISSPGEKREKSPNSDNVHSKALTETTSSTHTVSSHTVSSSVPASGTQSNSRISLSCGNMLLEVNHHQSAAKTGPLTAHEAASKYHLPGLPLPGTSGLAPYGYPPHLLGHSAQLDMSYRAALASHSASLSSHPGLAALKASELAAASATGAGLPSPYVAYATVKTAAGANSLVPICRDPYCTTCQINIQSAQLTACCSAGCTQCSHEKGLSVPTSLGLQAPGASSLPGVPVLPTIGAGSSGLPSSSTASSLMSLYPHALSSHHGLPYVCNWVAGSEYCGKRFTTSEDLLQHLRTHTSSSSEHSAALSAYSLAAASSLAAAHPHYSVSTPGSLSPNTLRRLYPTSLSPNRYHPYAKPSLPSLGSTPMPSLPLPSGLQGLGPYYSPYALYGQRLGAAVAP